MLARAAAVERSSEHPLARAIVAEAERIAAEAAARAVHAHAGHVHAGHDQAVEGHDVEHDDECPACAIDQCADDERCNCGHCEPAGDPAVTRFRAIAGRGVRGDLDGETVLVGKPELFDGDDRETTAFDGLFAAELRRLELEGKTVVVVGTPGRIEGLIAVADSLRPRAREALASLRRRGVRHIALLTGDNQATAAAIGRDAGVDEVRAGLLPEEKVAAVRELAARYGAVAMVGDGVNDAPALAAATVGIAMGAAGSDAALETADVALMNDDLAALAATVRLSRATTRVIRENIALAIAVKAVFLMLAPLGLVTLVDGGVRRHGDVAAGDRQRPASALHGGGAAGRPLTSRREPFFSRPASSSPADRQALAPPGDHAAVHVVDLLEPEPGQRARRQRAAMARGAEQHDRPLGIELGRAALRHRAKRDVSRARHVAAAPLDGLAHIDHLGAVVAQSRCLGGRDRREPPRRGGLTPPHRCGRPARGRRRAPRTGRS